MSTDEPQSPESEASPERSELPTWNRVKRKREVAGEEQDAFQQSIRSAGRSARSRSLVAVAIALLAVGALAGGLWWNSARAESRAVPTRGLAEAAAVAARAQVVTQEQVDAQSEWVNPPPAPQVLERGEVSAKVSDALKGLPPDSSAAQVGELLAASTQLRAGDHAAAEKSYRAVLDNPALLQLHFAAREGLAFALEGQGKLEEALEALEPIATKENGFYRDSALWHKGRILEAMDRKDEAIAAYKNYVTAFPLSEPSLAREKVRERLQELDPEAIQDGDTNEAEAPKSSEAP